MSDAPIVSDLSLENEPPGGASPVQLPLGDGDVRRIVEQALIPLKLAGRRVLLIVPDNTRTAPVGLIFREIYRVIGAKAAALDVMIALGTHPPMSEAAINARLDISALERSDEYGRVRYLNHEWDNPNALRRLGTISADEIGVLTGGLFSMDVAVTVNRRLYDYDQVIIIGPVFPHEVVGFSGGNKYLFPGVGGPELLNFFHWLGAVITNPRIIGHKWTAVRRVVDRAGAMVALPKLAFCMVVADHQLAGLFAGSPELAWSEAADLSAEVHVVKKPHAFHTVLSRAPLMYDDLWVGGKCMYKLEPVVADGGELIIYAPHIHQISPVHGVLIRRLGYHTRDYFLKQWDRFKNEPWGVVAHSTHVRGIGEYDAQASVETPRIRVTLATGIPESVCREIGLGYLDPAEIDPAAYAGREEAGVLYVPSAGETLFQLEHPPAWAQA